MPAILLQEETDFTLALWHITEPLSFFTDKLLQVPPFKNEGKALQWCATRYLLNVVNNQSLTVEKLPTGKPIVQNSPLNISLSHTHVLAAVMQSTQFNVGVDLEVVHPKVKKVAHKFLSTAEMESVSSENETEQLITYWSAKEALFKLYGIGEVNFRTELTVEPFQLSESGILTAHINGKQHCYINLQVHYRFINGHVLTYVLGR